MPQQTATVYVSNLPVNAIILWYGDTASIPTNWALCDGTNNTPDLRDRFIVGAGHSYAPGTTGGQTSVTLSVNNLPAHSHQYQVFKALDDRWRGGGESSPGNSTGGTIAAATNDTGFGTAFDVRPPYYALYYIMKVS